MQCGHNDVDEARIPRTEIVQSKDAGLAGLVVGDEGKEERLGNGLGVIRQNNVGEGHIRDVLPCDPQRLSSAIRG